MVEAHILLKSVLQDGTHEQIEILDVGSVSINDGFLVIYPTGDSVIPSITAKFFVSDIVGYWLEEM